MDDQSREDCLTTTDSAWCFDHVCVCVLIVCVLYVSHAAAGLLIMRKVHICQPKHRQTLWANNRGHCQHRYTANFLKLTVINFSTCQNLWGAPCHELRLFEVLYLSTHLDNKFFAFTFPWPVHNCYFTTSLTMVEEAYWTVDPNYLIPWSWFSHKFHDRHEWDSGVLTPLVKWYPFLSYQSTILC